MKYQQIQMEWKSQFRGFTLLEVLVSVATLTVILLLFNQIINSVSGMTNGGRERLNADAAARTALDMMGCDIASRVKRSDVDSFVVKQTGNDEFYFYSEAPAFLTGGTADSVALVGYRVSGSNGLERVGCGFSSYSGTSGITYLPSRLGTSVTNNFAATVVQPLSKEVFRMEIEFLKKDGTFVDTPPTRVATGQPAYYYVPASISGSNSMAQISADQLYDWSDIYAVVVTIACIDLNHRSLVTDLSGFRSSLGDAVASGTVPGTSSWRDTAETGNFSGAPKSAKEAVRVYRRFFPL